MTSEQQRAGQKAPFNGPDPFFNGLLAPNGAEHVRSPPDLPSGGARLRRRQFQDLWARRCVGLGGGVILACILGLLFVLIHETLPLWGEASAQPCAPPAVLSEPGAQAALILGLAVDEYREVACAVTATGLRFISLKDPERTFPPAKLRGLGNAQITSLSSLARGACVLGLSDGRLLPVRVTFKTTHAGGARTVIPELTEEDPLPALKDGRPVRCLASGASEARPLLAVKSGPQQILLIAVEVTQPLVGPARKVAVPYAFSFTMQGEISALALDGEGEFAFAGTSDGKVLRLALDDLENLKPGKELDVSGGTGAGVTRLDFLNGARTLVVGDALGNVTAWQVGRGAGQPAPLRKVHAFQPHAAAVCAFSASSRDKSFLTADSGGTIRLHYGTTGETRLAADTGASSIAALAFAPKGDGFLAADASGRLLHYALENPHPEVTARSLFGKVWYEGYPEPGYVWQSTGGTDEVEPKLSLVPLLWGSLKGTFYALAFALPLALLAALYTSQFMHPALRGWVKPAVELMAALPSVVLGFLASLWLAPLMERYAPGLSLMPLVVAAFILSAAGLWNLLPLRFRHRFRSGTEVLLLLPIVAGSAWLSIPLGAEAERLLLGGDYRGWLQAMGWTYDQRNSVVVGYAMGFAVIPVIFSIAEDALSNVPRHLTSGALALGASRWQTAVRVVVPTASPGLLSAVMIGFGRAVGETMIVLMATGNTPLMDGTPFNGFRALSANIATELPEAPVGGSLYRVLFLTALLLFAMTFAVNTVAELVRLRLSQRYRALGS